MSQLEQTYRGQEETHPFEDSNRQNRITMSLVITTFIFATQTYPSEIPIRPFSLLDKECSALWIVLSGDLAHG